MAKNCNKNSFKLTKQVIGHPLTVTQNYSETKWINKNYHKIAESYLIPSQISQQHLHLNLTKSRIRQIFSKSKADTTIKW